MWFCCYSFGSQLAWKNFDCSSLSQWQIPSRLLDRASSFSSFSHSLILPKMLFNTLSLPFSCYDYYSASMMVLGESQTLHQVAPGSIAGKFATFSLNFALNPLLRSAVQPSSARQFCILSNPINSIKSWWRGRSASSSNPSFGGSNISTRD